MNIPNPKRTAQEYALWAALPMAQTSQVEKRLRMILDGTRSRRALSRCVLIAALSLLTMVMVPVAILRPVARAQGVEQTGKTVIRSVPSATAEGEVWRKSMTVEFRQERLWLKPTILTTSTGHIRHLPGRYARGFIPHVTLSSKNYELFMADDFKGGLELIASYDAHAEVRVIAINSIGRHISSISIQVASAHQKIVARFVEPASKIKEVDIESRPFARAKSKKVGAMPVN